MVVKVYVSGISGNKEVKKRQQRVLMILDSKSIKYDVIDITEPGKETDKDFMQNNATSNGGTVSDPNPRSPLPPQLFNDDEYCGDYDLFDLANEMDTLEQFLKLEVPPEEPPQSENDKESTLNGDVGKESKENSQEKEILEIKTADNEVLAEKEKSPVKDGSLSRETTPAKEKSPVKEGSRSRETTPAKEKSPVKEGSLSREATPAKEKSPVKEGSRSREITPAKAEEEKSPEKESAPDRQKSVEKETPNEKEPSPAIEVEDKHVSKENTPEVESTNENGTVSSRDHSVEKEAAEIVERKKDPSEFLIESEQSAE